MTALLALYALPRVSPEAQSALGSNLAVDTPVAIAAGVAWLISLVTWLWVPAPHTRLAALITYSLSVAVIALVIASDGSSSSPFLSLWVLVSAFAGVFGIIGVASVLIIASTYLIVLFMDNSLSHADIIVGTLGGILPAVISLIIWARAANDTSPRRSRSTIPSGDLGELAGQSEGVINAIGDGVLAIDHHGIVRLINPAAQDLLGWTKNDAVNLNYKSLLKLTDQTGNEPSATVDPIQQVLNTNQEARSNTLTAETSSGKKIQLSLVVTPAGESGGGAIVVFRDITKEKAEEREQAEFISTASHEMRTPVASIEGYLGLALNPNTATVDEKARDFIQKAHESAQHLGRLFQDLLDVSKAEDGRLSNNPRVVDVVEFTSAILDGLQTKATEKGLQLTYKPSPAQGERGERNLSPVFYVNLDNDHIREIISNLTENAIKYTLNGEVAVDVKGDSEHVIVSVRDSGIGIPAEDLPHLFQKFYRVDNSDTREIGGTGLGLYLCRRLAEAMDGRIWVESEYKKGSTFYLELPRIDAQEAQRLKQVQANEAARSTPPSVTPTDPTPLHVAPDPMPPPQSATETPSAQPTPNQPIAAPSQPLVVEQPTPQPITPASATPINTPITAIEQNPAAYTSAPARQGSVTVPTRE